MLTRSQVKTPFGMKFYQDQRYLARPNPDGTYDIFLYTTALATRPDMEEFDPWARIPAGRPVDPTSLHHSETGKRDSILHNLTNGVKREMVRAELAKCTNIEQRIMYCLSLLWKVAKENDIPIESFEPRHNDVTVLMGPQFTRDELRTAIKKFKANPDDLKALMAEAITPETTEIPETTEEPINEFIGTDQPTG